MKFSEDGLRAVLEIAATDGADVAMRVVRHAWNRMPKEWARVVGRIEGEYAERVVETEITAGDVEAARLNVMAEIHGEYVRQKRRTWGG